jgi:hypothetical protein
MQAPPEPMQLPLEECMQTTSQNRAVVSTLLWPVRPVHHTDQTGGQDCPAPRNSHRSDQWMTPIRLMTMWKLHELNNSSKPLVKLLNECSKPKQAQTSPPC